MYGVYGELIAACERSLKGLEEARELIEYPEIQADKSYYLSVLGDYNRLNAVLEKLNNFKYALKELEELKAMAGSACTEEEKAEIFKEISATQSAVMRLAGELSHSAGYTLCEQEAFIKLKAGDEAASSLTEKLYLLIRAYAQTKGGRTYGVKRENYKNGKLRSVAFNVSGEGSFNTLYALKGVHRVVGEHLRTKLYVAVTPSFKQTAPPDESEIKIDLFHSGGAGGQNVNKVETAVRVTHLPTGTVVVCQDERSQLANKKRALDTLYKRLAESESRREAERIERDVKAQFAETVSPLRIDIYKNVIYDLRLESGSTALPDDVCAFTAYLETLAALNAK